MRNHPLFQRFDQEDSCVIFAHRADERYRERLRSERPDDGFLDPWFYTDIADSEKRTPPQANLFRNPAIPREVENES